MTSRRLLLCILGPSFLLVMAGCIFNPQPDPPGLAEGDGGSAPGTAIGGGKQGSGGTESPVSGGGTGSSTSGGSTTGGGGNADDHDMDGGTDARPDTDGGDGGPEDGGPTDGGLQTDAGDGG